MSQSAFKILSDFVIKILDSQDAAGVREIAHEAAVRIAFKCYFCRGRDFELAAACQNNLCILHSIGQSVISGRLNELVESVLFNEEDDESFSARRRGNFTLLPPKA